MGLVQDIEKLQSSDYIVQSQGAGDNRENLDSPFIPPRIPSQLISVSDTFELPVGITLNGVLHRTISLKPITARIRKFIFSNANLKNPGNILTTVFLNSIHKIGDITEITESIVNELLLGDRSYIILKLREISYREPFVQFVATCPECGKENTQEYNISKVPITVFSEKYRNQRYKNTYYYEIQSQQYGICAKFRFANGYDQVEMLKIGNTNLVEATQYLVTSTMIEWDTGNPDKSPLTKTEYEQLPSDISDWIVDEMSKIDYGPDNTVYYNCDCGRRDIPVVVDFLLSLFPRMRMT